MAAESTAVIVAESAPSETLCEAVASPTVGIGAPSSSRIVTVWTAALPSAAFVGVPSVTTTVSFDSTSLSSTSVIVMDPVVWPAGITSGPAGAV